MIIINPADSKENIKNIDQDNTDLTKTENKYQKKVYNNTDITKLNSFKFWAFMRPNGML